MSAMERRVLLWAELTGSASVTDRSLLTRWLEEITGASLRPMPVSILVTRCLQKQFVFMFLLSQGKTKLIILSEENDFD